MAQSLSPTIATDPVVSAALARDAIVAFSVSGGKDSAAATLATNAYLDTIGHDAKRRIVIHADLGRIEWAETPAQVAELADRAGLELIVVRRNAGDLIARWTQRFANGKARYEALDTYGLVGPWSSSALRFCTSELKTHVITTELRRRFPGQTVLSVVGLRRDESRSRALTPISKFEGRPVRSAAAPQLINWHPIAAWTQRQVYAWHADHGVPLHDAYRLWHATRMGCTFCVLASLHNLQTSASAPTNRAAFKLLIDLELTSQFSFQPARWLADIAPALLTPRQQGRLDHAKAGAIRRRQLEASLPDGLRFQRGWPPRVPTHAEAVRIVAVRSEILAQHGLTDRFATPRLLIERFAELHAARLAA